MEWSFAALPSPVQDMQLADHTKNEIEILHGFLSRNSCSFVNLQFPLSGCQHHSFLSRRAAKSILGMSNHGARTFLWWFQGAADE